MNFGIIPVFGSVELVSVPGSGSSECANVPGSGSVELVSVPGSGGSASEDDFFLYLIADEEQYCVDYDLGGRLVEGRDPFHGDGYEERAAHHLQDRQSEVFRRGVYSFFPAPEDKFIIHQIIVD